MPTTSEAERPAILADLYDCGSCVIQKAYIALLVKQGEALTQRDTLGAELQGLDFDMVRLHREIADRQAEIERLAVVAQGKVFDLRVVEGQLAVLKELEEEP